jgi:nanoRNase/pAp phosphatase (c-di-AMP/oligoRNAs hydrolase)
MMKDHSLSEGAAVITDLRGMEETYVGNRHVIYALFPDQNVSVRVFDGREKQFCVFSVGYSILNRTATVDVGKLMLKYGGGGHRRVGTCQVPYGEADRILKEIVEEINARNWQMLNIAGLEEF